MNLVVSQIRKSLKGEVTVPGDKSISHRALMLGAISSGTTEIEGLLRAEDTLNTAAALRAMGVSIEGLDEDMGIRQAMRSFARAAGVDGHKLDRGRDVKVEGVGLRGLRQPGRPLDMGNSGTGMRLLAGILAGQHFEVELTGDESLSSRPMDRIAVPLKLMGAQVTGNGEKCLPPLRVRGGKLKAIEYELPAASAQVKSAILLAGLYADGETEILEPGPSRDHTERMLQFFGADVLVRGPRVRVRGEAELRGQRVPVPGDISAAAFFMALAAIAPDVEVLVRGTGINTKRAGMIEVLKEMGAHVTVSAARQQAGEPTADVGVRCGKLKGVDIGGAIVPRLIDEVPILCVAAAVARGRTEIRDVAELRVKESDRIATMAEGLSRMGAHIEVGPDSISIGGGHLRGAEVNSHGDHRVAMALTVAGLVASGRTVVQGVECIATSYPRFAEGLRNLGADVREEE